MGRFLTKERKRQAEWRIRTQWLTLEARCGEGRYSKGGSVPYNFCLPLDCARQNLFPDIADQVIAYFRTPPGLLGGGTSIPWHDGRNGCPSTHLCDSQVCCVNFLAPFAENNEAASALLSSVFRECVRAVPVQEDLRTLVEFEWLGDPNANLLGEGSPRQRGANATSIDAATCFLDKYGHRHLVLIEWKYTESYRRSEVVGPGKFDEVRGGSKRRSRYGDLFHGVASPVSNGAVVLSELGYEPFYQFLRQQLLAQALEPQYSSVRVLHIAPRANSDFRLVTPERLRIAHPDSSATGVWKRLLRNPALFTSVYTEDLFAPLLKSTPGGLERWANYIADRYTFVLGE